MSTIDSKPDSPNKITISEDKKQLSITNPTTHNTVNITTGKTKFINVTAVGPQGQIGPEGAVGGTGTDADISIRNITLGENISGSSTSNIIIGGHITASGNISSSGGVFADDVQVSDEYRINDVKVIDYAGKINFGDDSQKVEIDAINIKLDAPVTASGDISASGEMIIGNNEKLYLNKTEDTYIQAMVGDIARVVAGGSQMLILDKDTGNRAVFGNGTKVFIGSNNNYQPTEALVVDGNISASGVLYAKEFHTNLVSSSIVFLSGSTKFGDTSDDIHQFTGSLDIHDGGITASTDIYLDNFADTAIRFIDGTGGGANNFLKYNEWKQAASAGTTINNTAGTINFDSKGNADVMVISGSNIGIGTTAPTKPLQVYGDISASGDLYLSNGTGEVFLGGTTEASNQALLTLTDASNNFSASLIQGTVITSLKLNQNSNQDFSIDTHNSDNNFYIEGTGGNVGIKKIPSNQDVDFTVAGDISASGDFYLDGEVKNDLTASGDISASGEIRSATMKVGTPIASGGASLTGSLFVKADANGHAIAIEEAGTGVERYTIGVDTAGALTFTNLVADTPTLTIGDNNNVGIGTTSPSQKLEVVGNISGSSVSASGDVHIGGDLYVDDLRSGNSRGFDFFTLGGAAQQINIGQLAMSASYTAGNTAVEAMNTTNAAMFGGDVSVGPHGNGKLGVGMLLPTSSIDVTGDLRVSSHITASGNISASGALMGNDLIIEDAGGVSFDIKSTSGDSFMRFIDGGTSKFSLGFDNGLGKFAISTGSGLSNNHAVTIESDGQVGIGTMSPTRKLHVIESTSNPAAEFTSLSDAPLMVESTDGTTGITFKDSDAEQQLYYRGDRNIFYIESPTKLGLGTNDPSETLDVQGSASFSGHITASGNISSSGILYGTDVYLGDDAEFRTTAGHLTIRPEEDLRLGTVSTDNILIGRTDTGVTTIQSKEGLFISGSGHITASGNISASGEILASDLKLAGSGIEIVSDSSIEIKGTGTSIMNIASERDLVLLAGTGRTNTDDDLHFGSAGVNSQMVLKDGKLGIGTTSPEAGHTTGAGLTINNSGTLGSQTDLAQARISASLLIKGGTSNFLAFDSNEITQYGDNLYFGVLGDATSNGNISFRAGISGSTNHTTRMFISSSGNIGIGTTAPIMTSGTGLMISDSTQANLRLADGSDYTDVANSAGDLYLINRKSDGRIIFRVNTSTEAIRITEDGSVGIGDGFQTSDPKNQLHITGSDGTTSGIRQSRAGVKIWSQEIDSSGRLQWSYRSTEAGSKTTTFTLDDNNNVGIGTGAPTHLLHVTGSNEDGEMIRVQGNSDRGGTIQYNRGTSYTWRAGVGGGSSTNSNIPSSFWGIEDVSDSNTVAIAVAHSTQNVGIGTINPDEKLEVSSNNPVVKITDTGGSEGSASIFLNESDSFGAILAYQSADNKFFSISTKETTISQRMTIDRYGNTDFNSGVHFSGSGNVGIGTTSPGEKLEVVGNISGSSTSTGSFAKIMLHYDDLPTSDPSIKGMVYRDGSNNLKISAG